MKCSTADPNPVIDEPAHLAPDLPATSERAVGVCAIGGWFIADDWNGDQLSIPLPPRIEQGC